LAAEVIPKGRAKEPTFADAWYELQCIVRWGRRRWKLALLLSLLVAAGAGLFIYRRTPLYVSTVVIDVEENNVFNEGPPPSTRELTRYIMGIALADTHLVELADKIGVALGPAQGGKPMGLDLFRDSIGVSVYYETAPSTLYTHTRIGLRYAAKDPESALKGARMLAEHVVTFQNRNRVTNLELGRELALQTEAGIAQRLKESEAELARIRLQGPAPGVAAADYAARLHYLQNEVLQLTELQEAATRNASQSVLRTEFERDASGLGYEIVDRGHLAPPRRLSQVDVALIVALFTLVGALPVVGLALGGLSFRAHDGDSLRRLGLTCFGQGYVTAPRLQSMLERRNVKRRRTSG